MPASPSGGPTGSGARPHAHSQAGGREGAPPLGAPGRTLLYRKLAALARRPRPRQTLLVGLDGPGGAGKSTLAVSLTAWAVEVRLVPTSDVVHLDDFSLPTVGRPHRSTAARSDAADVDLERLHRQPLVPLLAGREAVYQRYDWGADALAEWHTIRPGASSSWRACTRCCHHSPTPTI